MVDEKNPEPEEEKETTKISNFTKPKLRERILNGFWFVIGLIVRFAPLIIVIVAAGMAFFEEQDAGFYCKNYCSFVGATQGYSYRPGSCTCYGVSSYFENLLNQTPAVNASRIFENVTNFTLSR